MTLYTYRCPTCGTEAVSTERRDRLHQVCRGCGSMDPQRRVFGFAFKQPMAEHFNATVGKPVSSERQFADELKRAGERATIETGIEHNYKPVEWGDREALGVTGEGIAESNSVRAKRGDPLLPEIE